MTDPLRISSGDNKIPDLSAKKDYDRVIGQIRLMEPSTAYVAVQGIVIPILYRLRDSISIETEDSLQSPSTLMSPTKSSEIQAISTVDLIKNVDTIRENLQDIQNRIKNLEKNREKILSLLVGKNDTSSSTITDAKDGLWAIDDAQTKPGDRSDWRNHKGIFGEFYTARDCIEDKLKEINQAISDIEKSFPRNSSLDKLKEVARDLLKLIPEASSKWNKSDWTYDGNLWVHKYKSGKTWKVRFEGDGGNIGSNTVKNPIGLLEMTQNTRKLSDYLYKVTKGLKEIDTFSSTKKFSGLVQTAYMHLIMVIIPNLLQQSSEILEKQGETMKMISTIFDKWNEIQEEINTVAEHGKTIEEWIKDKKVTTDLELYTDSDLKEKETDVEKLRIWNSYKSLASNIKTRIAELKSLLVSIKDRLSPSAASLLDTMQELSEKLSTDLPEASKDGLSTFLQNKGTVEVEDLRNLVKKLDDDRHVAWKKANQYRDLHTVDGIWGIDSDVTDLQRHRELEAAARELDAKYKDALEQLEAKEKIIPKVEIDHRLGLLEVIVDADQTKFKVYMDNIAQGITALTSISNMTQQELQIATQYYNSLLSLQKIALDSLNKVIQVATKNPNH